MCFRLINLIKKNFHMTNSQKNFMIYMISYANPDGTNIFPSNSTIAEDFSLNRATVIRLRNSVVRDGWLVCVKAATSNKPAVYIINVELLENSIKTPVDKSQLGVALCNPGGRNLRPNLPITFNTNTVGFNKSVDNSEFEETFEDIIDPHLIEDDELKRVALAIISLKSTISYDLKHRLEHRGIKFDHLDFIEGISSPPSRMAA